MKGLYNNVYTQYRNNNAKYYSTDYAGIHSFSPGIKCGIIEIGDKYLYKLAMMKLCNTESPVENGIIFADLYRCYPFYEKSSGNMKICAEIDVAIKREIYIRIQRIAPHLQSINRIHRL